MDKSLIRNLYTKISKDYDLLGANLTSVLKNILKENSLDFLSVNYRVKDINSFLQKIDRKKYKDPFEEIEDICGLRIICYYESDIEKVVSVLSKELNILTIENKEELLDYNQFGYRSYHYIIKINKDWAKVPDYRNLENFKCELQIRTISMHAWAEISHKLSYKKKEHIPKQFLKSLSMIAAKLTDVDDHLNTLRTDVNEYKKEFSQKLKDESPTFDNDINVDNLRVFIEYLFPYTDLMETSENRMIEIVDFLQHFKLDFGEILKYYKNQKNNVQKINQAFQYEVEDDADHYSRYYSSHPFSGDDLFLILIYLGNANIWEERKDNFNHQSLKLMIENTIANNG
ncbi:hypothetical protein EMN47_20360 [Prolixibacteraceae bacterium JC049]|nr:hypothetical protein [Prolixibacteraceae bacterium JC049]